MPIYDYRCRACGQRFEAIVRPQDGPPVCPTCGSAEIVRQASSFAVATAEKRRAIADRQVRKAAEDHRRGQAERDRDADRHRLEEH
ncbi:MAG: zinc ribbon domain-containing protein [Acidobacteria bacterium]|nr:zinc ribbon domain-containing protein [Acidobacteriota bacterium]